jgi:hypothetical protein
VLVLLLPSENCGGRGNELRDLPGDPPLRRP